MGTPDELRKLSQAKLHDVDKPVEPPGVVPSFLVGAEAEHFYDHGLPPAYDLEWPQLRDLFRLQPGRWTMVSGWPNMGKSPWIANVAVHCMRKYGWKVAFFSPESRPEGDFLGRLCAIYTGKPWWDGPRERMSKREFMEAKEFIQAHTHWIEPENMKWDDILNVCRMLKDSSGLDMFVIDPYNATADAFESERGKNITHAINDKLTRLQNFVTATKTHAFVAVHPAKPPFPKDGKIPVATPRDASDSSAWWNKPDACVSIWRDLAEKDSNTQVHIQKMKWRYCGSIGMGELRFDRATEKYYDADQKAEPYHDPSESRLSWE